MTRNPSIDIAKGITILLVIVGHQGDAPEIVRHIIFSFHMPLFFILSGYFFKIKDTQIQMKTDAMRLLLPYMFTCGIFLVWWMLRYWDWGTPWMIKEKLIAVAYGSGTIHQSPLLGNVPMLGAIWFLFAMFWCKLAYRYIRNRYNSLIACALGGGIAATSSLIDVYVINLPWAILPGLSAIIFYMIGNMFMTYKDIILRYNKLLITLGFFCTIFAVRYSHLSIVRCSYGCYPIDIIGRVLGNIYNVYNICSIE